MPRAPAPAWPAAFYAAHHILAKGALFLAVGVVAATGGGRLWPVLLPAAVLALGFGGLPLTGGYVAKLAVKDTLGEGTVGLLATLAGAGSTLLMLHFLHRLRAAAGDGDTIGAGRAGAALAGGHARGPGAALGAVSQRRHRQPCRSFCAASAVGRRSGRCCSAARSFALLRRFGDACREVPEGDIVVLAERAGASARRLGAPLARAESALQRWPVAGIGAAGADPGAAAVLVECRRAGAGR